MPPVKKIRMQRLPTAALPASGYRVEVDDFLSACLYKLPCVYLCLLYAYHTEISSIILYVNFHMLPEFHPEAVPES